jgi:hypothetical protein
MTIISLHQPVYLPWLGFLDKIISSDKFVFLDDVQYEKRGFQNRNKIRTHEGNMWLTVPVKTKSTTMLKNVEIDYSFDWIKKHMKAITLNYSKTSFFNNYWPELEKIYNKKHDYLFELNMDIIKFLMNKLNIKTSIIFSSELKISEKGSDRILKICKELNADTYISGIGGKKYLNEENFIKNKINIKFQNFEHPIYKQNFKPFHSNMSAIDLLFNEGYGSEKIIKESDNF